MFEHCQTARVPLLYASSAAVYGASEVFVERPEHERPLNVYGYSKLLFDDYVRRQLPRLQAPVIGFRYFNVYGPGEAHKGRMASVARQFFLQYRERACVQLFRGSGGYADGEQRRDFVAVQDVARVVLHFLDRPQASGVFNLGSGAAASFNRVAQAVINTCRAAAGEPALDLPALVDSGAAALHRLPAGACRALPELHPGRSDRPASGRLRRRSSCRWSRASRTTCTTCWPAPETAPDATLNLTFLGAAGTVTGSKYLLEVAGRRLLIDCGLFQGYKQLRLQNWAPLPFEPGTLDAVLLTHAHIDHSGYLPLLVKNGYGGRVWCTPGTAAAVSPAAAGQRPPAGAGRRVRQPQGLLQAPPGAAAVRQAGRHRRPAGAGARGLWRVVRAVRRACGCGFGRPGTSLAPPAWKSKPTASGCCSAATWGARGDPVMCDPQPAPPVDYLVVESTYGDRLHPDTDPAQALADVINRTARAAAWC